jgi:aspartyl-tRNA synthetase
MAAGFERVFEIGPVFRANPSFTSRHDTEFTSIDMEVSWIDSHEDIMSWEERLLQYAISQVQRFHGDAMQVEIGVSATIPTVPFPRITLGAAKEILAARGHHVSADDDLDPQGERLLSQHMFEQYGHEFVFVTDYPATVRAFYHMRYEETPDITKSFDLLWRGLEVTTGAQREHRIDRLEHQAMQKGLSLEPLRHYLNFFRYGCPPHGGFGLGLTRLLMILLGMEGVRDVTLLYRGPNRITP